MKKYIILSLLAIVTMLSCKKSNVEPTPAPPSNYVQPPNNNWLDTSKSGTYKMVYCSRAQELDNNLTIKLQFKNYRYVSANDTTDKIYTYTILNNVNITPGIARISASITYTNEGVNHNQPYIDTHNGAITYGFIESSKVLMNTQNSLFNADTMQISFGIHPTTGPNYSMLCKYKKV